MAPRFFKTPRAFRAWFERHHTRETELLVGFYKVASGKPSITWPQSVDEALCFGWIDGVRRSIDDESYSIRFTPRKPTSIWSAVNVKRVAVLTAEGRMTQAGLDAFARRDEKRSAIYSYERGHAELDAEAVALIRADEKAWAYYEAQAPYYRRVTAHWVASAKRPETRARRIALLIRHSRKGERIPPLAVPSAAKKQSAKKPKKQ
jgi:uncharacterized protein YdeI (YjbR/CyaY-like superfamily)